MEIEAIPPSSSPELIRKLRAQRNAYALINVWFPTELIVAIFYDVGLDSRYSPLLREGFGGSNFYQNSIVISHVCQIWRTITIAMPRLWEGISLNNQDVTAVMLQRSGTSPILIDYNAWSDTEPPVSTFATALSHANRALEIDLYMPPMGLQSLLDEYLTKPMPFLRELTIRISDEPPDATPCFLPRSCLEAARALDRLGSFQTAQVIASSATCG